MRLSCANVPLRVLQATARSPGGLLLQPRCTRSSPKCLEPQPPRAAKLPLECVAALDAEQDAPASSAQEEQGTGNGDLQALVENAAAVQSTSVARDVSIDDLSLIHI